jgi:hypothetical protein
MSSVSDPAAVARRLSRQAPGAGRTGGGTVGYPSTGALAASNAAILERPEA